MEEKDFNPFKSELVGFTQPRVSFQNERIDLRTPREAGTTPPLEVSESDLQALRNAEPSFSLKSTNPQTIGQNENFQIVQRNKDFKKPPLVQQASESRIRNQGPQGPEGPEPDLSDILSRLGALENWKSGLGSKSIDLCDPEETITVLTTGS